MVLAILAALALPLPAVQEAPVAEGVRKPEPTGRPQGWLIDDDYPAGARRRREFGAVKFRADVDAKGAGTGRSTADWKAGLSGTE